MEKYFENWKPLFPYTLYFPMESQFNHCFPIKNKLYDNHFPIKSKHYDYNFPFKHFITKQSGGCPTEPLPFSIFQWKSNFMITVSQLRTSFMTTISQSNASFMITTSQSNTSLRNSQGCPTEPLPFSTVCMEIKSLFTFADGGFWFPPRTFGNEISGKFIFADGPD